MRFVNKKKVTVASYKEILIGFLTFTLILFVLYPKDLIMQQILEEKSNYDLSVLYLRNMLRNDPNNEKLILTLAQKSIQSQNHDFALQLLQLLKKSTNKAVQQKTYLLSYQLLKRNYFFYKHTKNLTKTKELYQQLEKNFTIIVKNHFYTHNDLEMLYKEAMFLQNKQAQYILLQQILHTKPNNKQLLSNAFYIASELNKYKDAFNYLHQLTKIDGQHLHKWNEAYYYLLNKAYKTQIVEQHLKQKANHSRYWQKKLILFYISHKQYVQAANYYMYLFKKEKIIYKKRKLWEQAISTLVSANNLKKAIALGSRYEDYFIHDKKARIMLLKLYLSANDVKKAKIFSQKILNLQE